MPNQVRSKPKIKIRLPNPADLARYYTVTVRATDGTPGVPARVVSAKELQQLYVAMGFHRRLQFELFLVNLHNKGRARLLNKKKTATLVIEPTAMDVPGYVN